MTSSLSDSMPVNETIYIISYDNHYQRYRELPRRFTRHRFIEHTRFQIQISQEKHSYKNN